MSDAKIVFNTEIDNSDVQKDMNAAKREIEKATKSLETAKNARLPLLQQVDSLGARLDEAKVKLAALQKQQAAADQALNSSDPGAYIEAYVQKPELDASVLKQSEQVDKLQKEWDQVNDKLDKYNQQINEANDTIAEQQKIAGDLSAKLTSGSGNMAKATEKADKSASKFQKRMTGIVKQVFMFGLVSKALYGVVDYMGKALRSNEEFSQELAKLKGALLTAFQPIYETLVPALIALMRIATSVAQSVAHVFSLLAGKNASEYAENAKALYEEASAIDKVGSAAKKASKSMAGFDEINQLSNSSDSTNTTAPDFSDFSTDEYKGKIDELTLYLSGALLVLGAILTFTGANIPLGVGLMAAGAIGLATEMAVNWDIIQESLQGPIGGVVAIVSGALLALGAILTFTGTNIPLGIGMMLVGAAGLATTAAVNWNSITEAMQGPVGEITAIASGALLVLGLILLFTGVGIPLGLGLILAGAVGLATAVAFNWDSIVDCIKKVWQKVVDFWNTYIAPIFTAKFWLDLAKTCGNGLIEGFEAAINGLIWLFESLINFVVDGLNDAIEGISSVTGAVGDLIGIDLRIPKIPRAELGRVSLPRLAQGAVIPPNREFLAVLGDQRHGTNIEAPLSTIQEAVAAVMADFSANNMAGHEATIGVLREILEAVLGIQIGDDVIGNAVNRYNSKIATARGTYV